jgi:hypothetical protein
VDLKELRRALDYLESKLKPVKVEVINDIFGRLLIKGSESSGKTITITLFSSDTGLFPTVTTEDKL